MSIEVEFNPAAAEEQMQVLNDAVRHIRPHIDDLDESLHEGPVDLDELFTEYRIGNRYIEDETLFSDDDDQEQRTSSDEAFGSFSERGDMMYENMQPRFFSNPNRRLLDTDASLIPGSPFSKPANRPSNRPSEPLTIAKYASTFAFLLTIGWVVFLFVAAIWTYDSVGRIIVEMILSLLSFFGLFWNTYFIVASIFKCLIPRKAFLTNTKYCSLIPETKDPVDPWLDVTIQIPVYKESLLEVMKPTLKSCLTARDYYVKNTGSAKCNIVVCDDGMMTFLRDNFPAAEMLWQNIQETEGRVLKLSKLLKHAPRAARRHLKGLRSRSVYEAFHRMLFYYHYKIGFVARSTVDRRGKFKKASNLNSHLRLTLGAMQKCEEDDMITFEEALMEESHHEDGSRFIMFGNDITLGHLICVNDADARMAEPVIVKTVPEFLNDKTLGFTQHTTKTMNEQRGESYFTNLLAVYTDALYQGHFLLSSILGCHPPLVGHSVFLRTEAVKQVGRVRTLRKAQEWLKSIGLQFLPVDQVGFANLQAQNRIEYWSENNVSEDFELMIHLYSLGFNGRYCAYPDCEFQEGITRTFDEEVGRHRKFSLGAHELVFNPFQDMLGRGIFTPIFKTFMTCQIPSYYKVFLSAYLSSYTSGGTYLIVFSASAIARILDSEQDLNTLSVFNPAGVIILNFVIYYVLGYVTFLISLLRMNAINKKLLFREYRKRTCGGEYLLFVMLRYCLVFQFLFYNVATFTFYFLGSMDHLLSRPGIVSATNKESIRMSRCKALTATVRFNTGSWLIAALMVVLAYATVVQEYDWDVTDYPDNRDDIVQHALFAGPAVFLAILAFTVPIVLNPYILGWPWVRQKKKTQEARKPPLAKTVDIPTLAIVASAKDLDAVIENTQDEPDVEIGSLATQEVNANPGPESPQRINPAFIKAREAEYAARLSRQYPTDIEAATGGRSRTNSWDNSYFYRGNSAGGRGRSPRKNSLDRRNGQMNRDGSLERRRLSPTSPSTSPRDKRHYGSAGKGPVGDTLSTTQTSLSWGSGSSTEARGRSPEGARKRVSGRRSDWRPSSSSPNSGNNHSKAKAVRTDEWGFLVDPRHSSY